MGRMRLPLWGRAVFALGAVGVSAASSAHAQYCNNDGVDQTTGNA
jgi:hypothetical protein